MKKGLFLLAAAALVLAGCNNDVTLDENTALVDPNQPQEISLTTLAHTPKRVVRRAPVQNGTFPTTNTMEVACYQSAPTTRSYFTKTTFSFVDDDYDVWHASPAKYWRVAVSKKRPITTIWLSPILLATIWNR